MKIEILGMGCAKCQKLLANAEQAVKEIGLSAEIIKIENPQEIVNYGVMMTPAIAIDGVVKLAGRIATVAEIKKFISQEK